MDAKSLWNRFLLTRILYGQGRKPRAVLLLCSLWLVVQWAVFVGVCIADGNLWRSRNSDSLCFLDDTVQLATISVLPLCFLVLYLGLRRYGRYLDDLENVCVNGTDPTVIEELRSLGSRPFRAERSRGLIRVIFAFGCLLVAYNVLSNYWPEVFYSKADKWDGRKFIVSYVVNRAFIAFSWGYALPVWCVCVYMMARGMAAANKRLSGSQCMKVEVFAADGAGGLRALGAAAVSLGWVVLPASLFLFAPIFRGATVHWGHYLLFLTCGPLAGALSLYPLLILHKAMQERKAALRQTIINSMGSVVPNPDALLQQLQSNSQDTDLRLQRMAALDILGMRVTQLPTWPLNTRLGSRLLLTVLGPALAFAVRLLPKFIAP